MNVSSKQKGICWHTQSIQKGFQILGNKQVEFLILVKACFLLNMHTSERHTRKYFWGNVWLAKEVRLPFRYKTLFSHFSVVLPFQSQQKALQGWPSVDLLKSLNKKEKEEEMADKSELSWKIYMHKYYI